MVKSREPGAEMLRHRRLARSRGSGSELPLLVNLVGRHPFSFQHFCLRRRVVAEVVKQLSCDLSPAVKTEVIHQVGVGFWACFRARGERLRVFVVVVPDWCRGRRWGEASGYAGWCLLCLWTTPGIRVECFLWWGITGSRVGSVT